MQRAESCEAKPRSRRSCEAEDGRESRGRAGADGGAEVGAGGREAGGRGAEVGAGGRGRSRKDAGVWRQRRQDEAGEGRREV